MMVVLGLLFYAGAYASYRWGGTFVTDPRKAGWYRWPGALLGGAVGTALVVGGLLAVL